MRRSALAGVILCGVLLVAGAVRAYLPPVEAERDVIVSSPSLSGIFVRSAVDVSRGERACLSPIPLDPEMTSAEILVNSGTRPPMPLEVSVRAPGYVARGRAPASYPQGVDAPVRVALDAPRRRLDGRLCVRNLGRRTVALVGTNEPRSVAIPRVTAGGKLQPPQNIALTFYGDTDESVLEDPGSVVSRASAFTAAYVPAWLVWVLVVTLLVGVPAGVILALAWALRSDAAGS
jgi:hypothetical protein